MQLILQISTHDFLELDELCESVKNATNEKITVTNWKLYLTWIYDKELLGIKLLFSSTSVKEWVKELEYVEQYWQHIKELLFKIGVTKK